MSALVAGLKAHGVTHLHYMAPWPNVQSIAIHGILSYNRLLRVRGSPDFVKPTGGPAESIADLSVQSRRTFINLPDGTYLHDYVPFYFGVHTPMQYVVTRDRFDDQARAIVFVEVGIEALSNMPQVWFTDGNAAGNESSFYQDPADLARVDWEIVLHEHNSFSKEHRRRKMAELLVFDKVGPEKIGRFVFASPETAEEFACWLSQQEASRAIPGPVPECVCSPDHFYRRDPCKATRLLPNV